MHWAKNDTSKTVEKQPAWPATPPMTEAFSSLTSPWIRRWRKCAVVFRRRDFRLQFGWRVEAGMR